MQEQWRGKWSYHCYISWPDIGAELAQCPHHLQRPGPACGNGLFAVMIAAIAYIHRLHDSLWEIETCSTDFYHASIKFKVQHVIANSLCRKY